MKKYLGVKLIEAKPCLGLDNKFVLEGNELCGKEKEGYKVRYEDGYTSWSPKDVFEKAYRPIEGLTFGLAIEALKQGIKVARKGWNGKGMYLWLLPVANVKKEWVKDPMLLEAIGDKDSIDCLGSIRMKTSTGEILTGWLASQTDMLAEDWYIVK